MAALRQAEIIFKRVAENDGSGNRMTQVMPCTGKIDNISALFTPAWICFRWLLKENPYTFLFPVQACGGRQQLLNNANGKQNAVVVIVRLYLKAK
ncbi:hypothetical protein [Pontibacter chitinilyticus]|uniref:hypothetical protein n=1 Tax=Pontibacter chitinilyticus TaxID=2674989 RepID=UPI00321BC736